MASGKPAAKPPEQSAAAKDKDKEEKPTVYRTDLGESLSQKPFPTATDNE